jgi:signal transduction histidine kinase
MLRSLSSRLIFAFAALIVFSVVLSAGAALFLLREQRQEDAEEGVGRLARPVLLATALLEQSGFTEDEIRAALRGYADAFDVRILRVDDDGRVVTDTDAKLSGQMVTALDETNFDVVERGGETFRMARRSFGGENLLVVAPPERTLSLESDSLVDLMSLVFSAQTADIPSDVLAQQAEALAQDPAGRTIVPSPRYTPLVAVPAAEVTAAWRDLLGPLAIAGAVALLASILVAVVISRSISRPLARITQAAQEMAHGRYDQSLEVRGQDEVARLSDAFNAMARQVSQSHQMMRDLLANVSHELKTPLTSIQGFSQALEEGAIDSREEAGEAAKIINEEAQRMRRLVDDLIDLSQLESGQAPVQLQPLDVADLLRVCARRFEWQLRESGVTLRLDVNGLPAIEGDEGRLEQAFSNLIDNAVRHTPAGGTITVGARAANGNARVAVHNTGSYIPKDDQSRVFERFFRVDRNRARVPGYGLGLAIVSEIIHAHGGAITLESDQEKGTTFIVSLPLPAGAHARNGA